MLAQQESVVLKLFAGPQAGAEALLPPGEYILGRDESCDLIIDDILVEAQHCRLVVNDDCVELQPLNGQVYVEGEPFESGMVELFDYVMIGGSCFALGTNKSQWPTRPLPPIRRDPVEQTKNPAASTESVLLDDASSTERDPTLDSSNRSSDGRRTLAVFSLLASMLLMVAILIVAASGGSSEESTIRALDTPIEERLWEIARGQGFESDLRIENTSKGWTVVGYLDKRADRQQLSDEFRRVLPSASIKLWDSESLAESVQAVLKGLHLPLAVKPGKAGAVIVSGTIMSSDQWSAARDRIVRDVVAIRVLDDQAVTVAETRKLSESPRKVAIESSLPALVESEPKANSITVPAIHEPPAIIRNVYLLPEDADVPPRPTPNIRSVSVGACQSLITTEGTRVMKGGRLDGWMVMEISEDKVVLERGKFRHIVDLLAP